MRTSSQVAKPHPDSNPEEDVMFLDPALDNQRMATASRLLTAERSQQRYTGTILASKK